MFLHTGIRVMKANAKNYLASSLCQSSSSRHVTSPPPPPQCDDTHFFFSATLRVENDEQYNCTYRCYVYIYRYICYTNLHKIMCRNNVQLIIIIIIRFARVKALLRAWQFECISRARAKCKITITRARSSAKKLAEFIPVNYMYIPH